MPGIVGGRVVGIVRDRLLVAVGTLSRGIVRNRLVILGCFGVADAPPILVEHSEIVSSSGVPSFARAAECILGFGELFVLDQQHCKFESPVGVAPLVSPEVRRRRAGHVTSILEKHAQLRRGGRMAAPVGAFEGSFGIGQPALPDKQHRELECCVGHSALVRPLVRRHCARNVSTVREQHAEVEGGSRVTATVGARKQILGLGQPVLGCEPNAKIKRAYGIDALVCAQLGGHGISQALAKPRSDLIRRALLFSRGP